MTDEKEKCSTCQLLIPNPVDHEDQIESFECDLCKLFFCIKCIPHNDWETDDMVSICPNCFENRPWK